MKLDTPLEYDVQLAVCDYIRARYPGIPFNSDGAGTYTTPALAGRAVPLRVAPGWPDLNVATPRGKYHGLYLELKRPGEDPYLKGTQILKAGEHLANQEAMLEMLQKQGYCTDFATGYDEATWKIDWYMNLPQVQGELS